MRDGIEGRDRVESLRRELHGSHIGLKESSLRDISPGALDLPLCSIDASDVEAQPNELASDRNPGDAS